MKPASFLPFLIGPAFLLAQFTSQAQPLWTPASWTWEPAASMNQARGYFPAVSTPDGKVYVFGGATDLTTSLNQIEEYDVGLDEWTVMPYTLPQPMCAMAAVALDGAIYIIGGADYFSAWENSTVYRFFPDTGFDADTLEPLPAARAFLSACVTPDGKIFAIGGAGGATGEGQNSVYIYDPLVNSWETGPSLNIARANHTSVVVGNKIYVMGGSPVYSSIIHSVEVLDLDNMNGGWVEIPEHLLNNRALHGSAVVFTDVIVSLGGIASITEVAMTMEGFAPEKAGGDNWEVFGNLEYDRRAFGCVSISEREILIMGGNSNSAGSPLSSAQILDLTSSSREAAIDPQKNTVALLPNTPNPFDHATEISFTVTKTAEITIAVFDATGQWIATPVSGLYGTGTYRIPFDGTSQQNGVYFCVLKSSHGPALVQKWVVLHN